MKKQLAARIFSFVVIFSMLLSVVGMPPIVVKATSETISYLGGLGSAVTKTSGTSLVITTTTDASNGDDILVAVATDPNSSLVVSVADTGGNSYSQVSLVVNSGNVRTYLFAAYDINAMPSGSSITVTSSPAVTARAAVAALFRGLDNSDQLDQTKTGTGTSTVPSSGATSTTTQTDELLIGVVGTEGPDGDAAGTWDASFTAGPRLGTTGTDDTNITVSLGYRIVSSIGAYTASKTGITSRDWGAIIATFKAGVGTNPAIYTTGTPLSAFSTLPGVVSAEKNFSVSGINLTDDISITAPADFEISLTSGSGFGSSLTLSPSGGSVAATPIYVHFYRASEGSSSGNITLSSSGTTTRNVAVSGTAAPLNPVSFNIMLGRPTDVSVTANIIPDQDVEFYIEYGTAPATYSTQTTTYNATASNPIEFVIGSLSANTRYYYRIVYRRTGMTDWNYAAEHSFMTQRPASSPFVFTVTSDNHLGQYGGQTADELALWQLTLQNILGDHPDFHIDTGDTFPMDPSPLGTGMTDAEGKAAYYYDRPYLAAITDSIPYFQVLGNHENEEGWNFDDVFTSPDQSLALAGMKYRKMYYPNPVSDSFYSGNTDTSYGVIGGDTNQEDYWAWTWGDALFVAIDPFHYSLVWPDDDLEGYGGEGQDSELQGTRWDWSLGIQQYLWLKSVLENSTAKYKFVFTHEVSGGKTVYGRGGQSAAPLFEWGGKNADGTWGFDVHRPSSDGWTLPIHQLMVKNGVNIFFHGHDHDYARELVDGIVYLECPKPDDAGYAWDPYSYGHNEGLYPNAIVELQNSGYFRVNVSPSEAKVEYVRSYLPGDGTNRIVADSVTVPGTPPTSYRMMVDKAGPGSGTVTSDLSGINCGSTCSAAFSTGASVTLTAAPAGSSTFTGWGGDCSGTGTCSLTMNSAHVVSANFSAPGTTYTLTVNAGSNGTINTPAGTTTRNAGEVVTITATPNSGYHFVNWTGDRNMVAHTTGASTSITMKGNYTITANFAANTSTSYTLTMRAGSGGTVTAPSSSPGSYTSGTAVTLTASASPGYHFVNWTGLVNTVANTKLASTTVIMNGSYVIQANFAPNSGATYTLTANNDGHGTVTLNPSGGTYTDGTTVTLTPQPSTGYQFSSWSGANASDIVNTSGVYTIVMNSNKTVQANFAQITYLLTANNDGHGMVTLDPSGGTYTSGTTVTLTPVPNTGYQFNSWSGANASDIVNTSGVYTIVMNGNKTVQANFSNASYTLTVSLSGTGSGTVISSPVGIDCGYDCSETYPYETSVMLTATPTNNYHRFTGWSGTGISCPGKGTCTVLMTAAKTVTATFEKSTFGDVPFDHPHWAYIQALYDGGYTSGCSTSPMNFCPEATLTRAESAVFMLRGLKGTGYTPPADPAGYVFVNDDWAPSTVSWARSWSEGMWDEGMTSGCQDSPLKFCPAATLTRAEGSVFGERIKHGMSYTPPAATHIFTGDDWTPASVSWAEAWAEQAYNDGLLLSCGTGPLKFCPADPLSRSWAAYIIAKAKGLTLP